MNNLPMNSTDEEVRNEIRQKLLLDQVIPTDWVWHLVKATQRKEHILDLEQQISENGSRPHRKPWE